MRRYDVQRDRHSEPRIVYSIHSAEKPLNVQQDNYEDYSIGLSTLPWSNSLSFEPCLAGTVLALVQHIYKNANQENSMAVKAITTTTDTDA